MQNSNDQMPASSEDQSIRLRMRADLQPTRQEYLGRRYWLVKDPLALKYYRFEEEEFALLEMLDGQISLSQLQKSFEDDFAPQRITIGELQQFIGLAYRSALLVSNAAGQGKELFERETRRRWQERIANFSSPLCIRFQGFDPDRFLSWLNGFAGRVFSIPAFICVAILAISALLLVTAEFDVFRAKLPEFHGFFATENWFWLAVALALTKVLHEVGHGLACKRFGGECHEMGFMLLVLTPCLYCNVTDSWMLPDKWKRIAVGVAGMYVEIALAAICTFIWWCTRLGLLHFMCLNVMFVCSVSTILFNANPLLRYDGYYILADFLEIPNLRQKAALILKGKLGGWLLGLRERPDPFLPQRRQSLLAGYCIAAVVYRWLVLFSILWFLNRVFEPYGLQIVGQLIACVAIGGLVVQPLWRLWNFLHIPGRIQQMKRRRVAISATGVLALVAIALFVPLPYSVRCSFHIQPRGAANIYVAVPGRLEKVIMHPGERVEAGQPVARLTNIDHRLAVARVEGERAHLTAKLAGLRQQAFNDETALAEITHVKEAIAGLDEQLQRRRRDLVKLSIVSPATGTLFPAHTAKRDNNDKQLAVWSGQPLEIQNVGAYLDYGTILGRVADPRRWEAVLAIDESDVEFVKQGQSVDLLLHQLPLHRFQSTVKQLAQTELNQTDHFNDQHPVSAKYQATCPFDIEQGTIFPGSTGCVRIRVGYRTLGERVGRYFAKTFSFDL